MKTKRDETKQNGNKKPLRDTAALAIYLQCAPTVNGPVKKKFWYRKFYRHLAETVNGTVYLTDSCLLSGYTQWYVLTTKWIQIINFKRKL